ncbi:rhodanese-like domain-containing protein [Allofustis seminis]|uniref:rhodanese-like domain-containing protein n=1 Tax=Allofustis seminis TaxID=166939 RepID=UPI001FE06C9C|nr:rhodanese-like domain-containing protein [Allofustis seminis]
MRELTKYLASGNHPNLNILDVCSQEEFAAGHIPGAIHWPLTAMNVGKFPNNKLETYYVVCRSGGRSKLAVAQLKKEGYMAVNVEGGMLAYCGPLAY